MNHISRCSSMSDRLSDRLSELREQRVTVHTRCPVVRISRATFVQYVNIGGELRREPFVRPVHWLQRSRTLLQFVHGGQVLLVQAERDDHHGYLDSADPSAENWPELPEMLARFGIDAASTLEARLMTVVELHPVFQGLLDADYNRLSTTGLRQYTELPADWRLEMIRGEQGSLYALEDVGVAQEVTWSSKRTLAENEQALAAFRNRYKRESLATDAVAPPSADGEAMESRSDAASTSANPSSPSAPSAAASTTA